MKILINEIVIGDRGRVDMGEDMEQLQESIHKRGLINPICITKEKHELIAGFRRLTCCRNLGHTEIEVKFYEELSDLDKKILELEENIHKTLTWDEKAKLRMQIHQLYQQIHGKAIKGHESDGWGISDTAELLGISKATMSQDILLSEATEILPELRKKTSRRQALKFIDKIEETELLIELARRDAEESADRFKQKPYVLFYGDAVNLLKEKVEDEVVDLVIFDPPWGIDIHKIASSRGPRGERTSYKDDSEKTAIELNLQLMPELHRVMKPDAHMYMFIGIQYKDLYRNLLTNYSMLEEEMCLMQEVLPDFFSQFRELWRTIKAIQAERSWSFYVEDVPLVWVKEGGGFTDFEAKFMPRYESILFCSKGRKKKFNVVSSNVFEYRRPLTTERIHTQEKPIELIQKFIEISSQPNEIILDPCAGSFATAVAATLSGRRSVCIDNDKVCYAKGIQRLADLLDIGGSDEDQQE